MSQTHNVTPRQRSQALAVVAAAMVLDLIDTTIMNVALPTLERDFHASQAAVQWMVAGYSSSFAVLLITGGRLGDIISYRRCFLLGVAGFAITSLLCGLAPSPAWLAAARLLQGGTAALMLPQVMSLIQVMYPPHERMAALGIFGVLGGLAAVLGPVIGGALLSANLFGLGWRMIFLVNLPVASAALFFGMRVLPGGGSPHAPKLDMPGTILVMGAIFGVIFPVIEGGRFGWPWWCIAMPVAAIALTVLLVVYSTARMRRDGSSLIVPHLFAEPSFVRGLGATLAFQFAGGGFLLCFAMTLQQGFGFSAAETGLTHVPYAAGASFAIGRLSRQLLPRLGPGLIAGGASLMLAGLCVVVMICLRVPHFGALVAIGLLPMGLGMGLTAGPLPTCTLSEIDPAYAGAASGTLKATQQLGTALGAAAIGVSYFAVVGSGAGYSAAFLRAAEMIGVALLIVIGIALTLPRNLRVRGSK